MSSKKIKIKKIVGQYKSEKQLLLINMVNKRIVKIDVNLGRVTFFVRVVKVIV